MILGIYGELAFRQGSSITTLSPSNTGLIYTGQVDSRATGSLMLRLSVPLGGGPLFRVDSPAFAHFSDQTCSGRNSQQFLAQRREAIACLLVEAHELGLAQLGQPRVDDSRTGADRVLQLTEAPWLLASSQTMRKVQRRPSRSSSTMIGRPVVEPRTRFTIYYTPLLQFL